MITQKAAQVEAINSVLHDIGGLSRAAVEDEIKALASTLKGNELPEKALVVEYQSNDTCLLVATNLRVVLIGEVGFSLAPKIVWDFHWDKVSSVAYSRGRFRHRITVNDGRKKEDVYGLWRDGEFKARKMAEYMRSRVDTQPPVSETVKSSQADAIHDAFRAGSPDRKINQRSAQHIQDVLRHDELPERIIASGAGALVATNQRLVFVHGIFSLKAKEFPYDKISYVQTTTGRLLHAVSVHVEGKKNEFHASSNNEVVGFAEFLRAKISECLAISIDDNYKWLKEKSTIDAIRKLENFDILPVESEEIRHLPQFLVEGEFPEKIEPGQYNYRNGLLVATNHRLIFLDKAILSLKLDDFPYGMISTVEFSTKMMSGTITIDIYGNTEKFHGADNKGQLSKFAEHLRERVHDHTSALNTLPPVPDKASVAENYKGTKANAIEDAVRELNDLNGLERTLEVGGELKQLPNILAQGELPERVMPGSYDDRHGLRVSKTTNRTGLLVATDRRFIFVDKQIGSVKVDDLPYDKISWVESSTGWATGKITIHESNSAMMRVYEGDAIRIQRLSEHLQEKISAHPAVQPKSKKDVIASAIAKLGWSKDALDMDGIRCLPNILEDSELPEKMTSAKFDEWAGVLVATPSRLIFVELEGKHRFKAKTFSYPTITSVESSPGMLFGKITIESYGTKEIFDWINNGAIKEFEEYIRAKISAPVVVTPAHLPPASIHISVADELEKLSDLVDKGILTPEEFETQKRKLLQG